MSLRGANASSGMGVAEHSKNTFAELQRKKVYRYVVFKIDERKKEVVVEKTGVPAESYEDFTASLPENADMLSMTLILLPQRTAKRAKFSSLHGPPQGRGSVLRCYIRHPRTDSGESLTACTMSYRPLIVPSSILRCSATVLIEPVSFLPLGCLFSTLDIGERYQYMLVDPFM
ncbi:unnamed protein product [Cuscuta campestris]|uniref:ADF-H domain-containing protein n=1 Tax=Cuscuta campestris TaxID=132261 RepID=A0A484KBI6_9ASTE|nr:unnamed protein product [Cuscuta campestris]